MDNNLFSGDTAPGNRPLRIDFDFYTEGDEAYKKELGGLIIQNLREFQSALRESIQTSDPDLFRKACHKSKVTLSMLADPALDRIVEDLDRDIGNPEKKSALITTSKHFNQITGSIINSLKREIGNGQ